MSKLLLISHDDGTWAYQVDNDAELKDRLAIEFFDEPWGKLHDEHEELNEILKELVDDGGWTGEQCSATLYQEGGVGGWRAEKRVLAAAKKLYLDHGDDRPEMAELYYALQELERAQT